MEFSAAYQKVKCANCNKEYLCTPAQDYYHKPDVPSNQRTLTNGFCETCLMTDAGIHPDKVVTVDDNLNELDPITLNRKISYED